MTRANRRQFLKQAGATAAGAAAGLQLAKASLRAAGANERITIAQIGCGGQGSNLLERFAAECNVAYVCDPDANRAQQAAKIVVNSGQPSPKVVGDFRRILSDNAVDAVVVATPDHWHAPAAILFCEAGKHVYVEKPCSHNLREGRMLVEAARRNKRIVQHGTQSRSIPLIVDAVQMLREGIIGDVLVARAWNVQRRNNIGRAEPSAPPADLDYDMWVGPAEFLPYQSNRCHYNWHWWHNFGTGDMGNDGVHEIDYARWGLGVDTHPARISGLGGKYYFDDDQQFPDTQQVAFEYPDDGKVGHRKMLVWEMRIWSNNFPYNIDNGAEFFGTKGKMVLTKRGKVEVYGDGVKRIDAALKGARREVQAHHLDFLDAIRDDRRPNADIEIGHLSASLCHLGNIATRVGRTLQFDPQTEQIKGDDEANALLGRKYRDGGHWAMPSDA